MSVFVVCSAAAAAGLAVAFEIGRVCEKRTSGISKVAALPFQDFDWKSENAKAAAGVFVALFFVEIVFLPRSWNPFSYVLLPVTDNGTTLSSFLAFLVFGSWSGILAMGYGSIAASFQALKNEQVLLESEKSEHGKTRIEAEQKLEEDEFKILKEKRAAIASAAAVAGEWKKLHIAREEHHDTGMVRSENEKIWSKMLCQGGKEFDKKTIRVVDNAIDMRWREVEDQGHNLEEMRKRNKEKGEKIKEQRARRAERANTQQNVLVNEKLNLLNLTNELESLKVTMEKHKEENTKKEQQKIQELKFREIALKEKERDLEQCHHKKLEELKEQERIWKEKQERFESGDERKKLQEMSEKLESSKLNVAKFNEKVMMKEKQKIEEFERREMVLREREEESLKMSAISSIKKDTNTIDSHSDPESNVITEEMPDDEAFQQSNESTEEIPDDEAPRHKIPEKPTDSYLEFYDEEGPDDEINSTVNGLPSTRKDELGDGQLGEFESVEDDHDLSAMNNKNDVDAEDNKSVSSILLLAEQDILPVSSSEDETVNDLPTIREDASGDLMQPVDFECGEDNDLSAMNNTVDVEERSVSIHLLSERDILSASEDEMDHPSAMMEDANTSENPDELHPPISEEQGQEQEQEESVELPPTNEKVAHSIEVHEEKSPKHPLVSLMDLDEDEDDDDLTVSVDNFCNGMNLEVDDENIQEPITSTTPMNEKQSCVSKETCEQEEESRILDKCGSEKSLLDLEDGEEIDRNDDDDGLKDANSSTSHQLLDCDSENSLSYQIQYDIAAKIRVEDLNVECSGTTTTDIGEPTDEDTPSVSSPLQEKFKNVTFDENATKTKNETTIEPMVASGVACFKDNIPVSPASASIASIVSFQDCIPVSVISEINSTDDESFKDAFTIVTTTSDPDYVILKNKTEKENDAGMMEEGTPKNAGKCINNDDVASPTPSKKDPKMSLVVSEEAAVEVIAWSEPGLV